MVGIIYHYPPPRKAVLRPRFNIKTRTLLSRSSNVDFERLSHLIPWASISEPSLRNSTCASVIPSPNSTKAPEQVEQIQPPQFPENVQLPYAPQLPYTPIPTYLQFSKSSFQEQPIQSQYTKSPAFHIPSHPEQHIPAYEPLRMITPLPNAPDLSTGYPEPALGSIALQQQRQPSEHMDIDCPQQLISQLLQTPQAQTMNA